MKQVWELGKQDKLAITDLEVMLQILSGGIDKRWKSLRIMDGCSASGFTPAEETGVI